jgi:hypothetical protein
MPSHAPASPTPRTAPPGRRRLRGVLIVGHDAFTPSAPEEIRVAAPGSRHAAVPGAGRPRSGDSGPVPSGVPAS